MEQWSDGWSSRGDQTRAPDQAEQHRRDRTRVESEREAMSGSTISSQAAEQGGQEDTE